MALARILVRDMYQVIKNKAGDQSDELNKLDAECAATMEDLHRAEALEAWHRAEALDTPGT